MKHNTMRVVDQTKSTREFVQDIRLRNLAQLSHKLHTTISAPGHVISWDWRALFDFSA